MIVSFQDLSLDLRIFTIEGTDLIPVTVTSFLCSPSLSLLEVVIPFLVLKQEKCQCRVLVLIR